MISRPSSLFSGLKCFPAPPCADFSWNMTVTLLSRFLAPSSTRLYSCHTLSESCAPSSDFAFSAVMRFASASCSLSSSVSSSWPITSSILSSALMTCGSRDAQLSAAKTRSAWGTISMVASESRRGGRGSVKPARPRSCTWSEKACLLSVLPSPPLLFSASRNMCFRCRVLRSGDTSSSSELNSSYDSAPFRSLSYSLYFSFRAAAHR
mmetsp:Transcript_11304/g.39307  ORF Transcript_11304/g.39307 Transcript_11304/m.39307 type:complete len:208 (+) Transcript_11304:1526-2149(+)